MDTRFFVITHKKVRIPLIEKFPEYTIVQAGDNKTVDLGYFRVNTRDNIADWNHYYSDLTAHYWLWKNWSGDTIGFSHYHRFFCIGDNLLTKQQAEQILNEYDIILPQKYCVNETIAGQWMVYHRKEDLELIKESLIRLYPEDYALFLVLLEKKGFHPFNLFICSKRLFDEYCSWLFAILEDMKRHIRFGNYESDEWKRIGGFAAERLLNLWVLKKDLRIFEVYIKDYGKETFLV